MSGRAGGSTAGGQRISLDARPDRRHLDPEPDRGARQRRNAKTAYPRDPLAELRAQFKGFFAGRRRGPGASKPLGERPVFITGLFILHIIYNALIFSFLRFSTSSGVTAWVTIVAILSVACVVANIKALQAMFGDSDDDDAAWFRQAFRSGTMRAIAAGYLGAHLALTGIASLVFGLSILVGGLFLI
ncbi:MAG: hypothetical protein AAF220_04855 [Pseudomonadota bacterium]